MSRSHNFYNNWSPAFFQKMAQPYGAAVVEYIDSLIEQAAYPEVAYKQCLGIIALSKTYEKSRLNNACKRGLTFHRYGYHIIKNILENKMDVQQSELITTDQITQHENIRGADYYQ